MERLPIRFFFISSIVGFYSSAAQAGYYVINNNDLVYKDTGQTTEAIKQKIKQAKTYMIQAQPAINLDQYSIAMQNYKNALAIWQNLNDLQPKNIAFLDKLCVTHKALADSYGKHADYQNALRHYIFAKSKIRRKQQLTLLHEADFVKLYKLDQQIALTYGQLDYWQYAIDNYEQAYYLIKERLAKQPSSQRWRLYQVENYSQLAYLLKQAKKYPQALIVYRTLLQKTRSKNWRYNAKMQFFRQQALQQMVDIYSDKKHYNKALIYVKASLKIAAYLNKNMPTTIESQKLLIESLQHLGELYNDRKNTKKALQAYQASLKVNLALAQQQPDTFLWQKYLMLNYMKLAVLEPMRRGVLLNQALTIGHNLEQHYKSDSQVRDWIALLQTEVQQY